MSHVGFSFGLGEPTYIPLGDGSSMQPVYARAVPSMSGMDVCLVLRLDAVYNSS